MDTAVAGAWLVRLGIAAAAAAVVLARRDDRPLSRRLAAITAAALTASLGCLLWALVTGDFSLVYVADFTDRATSWPYRVAGLWGGMGGSLLFFSTLVAAAALLLREPVARAVMTGLAGALALVVAVAASPFDRLAVPAIDGGGLTPILEHPAMLYHPPLLYAGLVGCLALFALAVGGWHCVTVRRAAGASWVILTGGLLAGAHWAYVELGWGGFWAWDPVENAGLLPWLATTALLHGLLVEERTGRLSRWNTGLAAGAGVLAMLGALLTRSGVASSVHAFGEARAVGWSLLALAVVMIAAAGATVARRRTIFGGWRVGGGPTREAALLVNNIGLLAIAAVVVLGTMVPLVSDLLGSERIVEGRFFARFSALPALVLLALVGIGPRLRWRDRGPRQSVRDLRVGVPGAAVAGAAAAAAGVTDGFALAAAVVGGGAAALVVAELARPATRRSARRAGALVAHLGVVVLLAGVAGAATGETEAAWLAPGQSVEVGPWELRHAGVGVEEDDRHRLVVADVAILRDGDLVTTLHPAQKVDEGGGRVLAETALRSTPASDLLVALRRVSADGRILVEAWARPLVMEVWLGGLLVLFGGALALSRRSGRPASARGDGRRLQGAHPAPASPPDQDPDPVAAARRPASTTPVPVSAAADESDRAGRAVPASTATGAAPPRPPGGPTTGSTPHRR